MKKILLLSAALATAGCTLNLQLQPQIPPATGGPKIPAKLALIVPASSREVTQAEALPTGCFNMTIAPAPHGEIFAQTMQGVFQQYFNQVVLIESLPAPADADVIAEATLTRIGVKFACLASSDFYAQAEGGFRMLDSQGRELWRSSRTSAKTSEGLPMSMGPYQTIMPKAMAELASSWASDMAMAMNSRPAAARPAERAPSAESAGSSGSAPWWQK
jgi:hypothetical protein